MEEVRDEEERLGDLERAFPGCHSHVELDEGVDRHQLNAGALVDLTGWDVGEQRLDDAVGAPVAVMHRVLDQPAGTVEEGVVDAP